jgi:hypothetical protein
MGSDCGAGSCKKTETTSEKKDEKKDDKKKRA